MPITIHLVVIASGLYRWRGGKPDWQIVERDALQSRAKTNSEEQATSNKDREANTAQKVKRSLNHSLKTETYREVGSWIRSCESDAALCLRTWEQDTRRRMDSPASSYTQAVTWPRYTKPDSWLVRVLYLKAAGEPGRRRAGQLARAPA